MKPSRTIKYKALFLLVSFSLYQILGFACSLGFDVDFNAHHHDNGHHEKEHSEVHDGHTRGQDSHGYTHQHQHVAGDTHHNPNAFLLEASEDEHCCNNYVVGFQNLDKQVVEKFSPVKQKIEHVSFVFPSSILISRQVYTGPVRNPPKIPDKHSPPGIRVFIQSFQI